VLSATPTTASPPASHTTATTIAIAIATYLDQVAPQCTRGQRRQLSAQGRGTSAVSVCQRPVEHVVHHGVDVGPQGRCNNRSLNDGHLWNWNVSTRLVEWIVLEGSDVCGGGKGSVESTTWGFPKPSTASTHMGVCVCVMSVGSVGRLRGCGRWCGDTVARVLVGVRRGLGPGARRSRRRVCVFEKVRRQILESGGERVYVTIMEREVAKMGRVSVGQHASPALSWVCGGRRSCHRRPQPHQQPRCVAVRCCTNVTGGSAVV
jgi:hypothetical protein